MISKYDSDSDTESFKSFDDNEPSPPVPEEQANQPSQPSSNTKSAIADQPNESPATKPVTHKFEPEEEKALLTESNTLKTSANQLFGKGSFENAIQTYDRALASCPNYLDYEIAVLRSNVAACHLKLQEWKEAVESATKGVECLERLEPLPSARKDGKDGKEEVREGEVVEVDDSLEERIERLNESGHTIDEVRKLQIKLLMRRGKGRSEQGTWTALQGADEDYRTLLHQSMLPSLSSTDRRQVMESLQKLTPKLEEAKNREMAEMMDKLKGLGNSILKPFGLSTENFQFVKDETTGGYSMNFNQGAGGKK